MIPILDQIKVIRELTKQAREAVYDLKAIEVLEVREMALEGLLRDLEKEVG